MSAKRMRDNCAFTSRDMSTDWADAFTYAIVFGWDGDDEDEIPDCWQEHADLHGWDEQLVDWLKRAHEQFEQLGASEARP